MRRTCVLPIALAAAAVLATPTGAAAKRTPCSTAKGTTVAASPDVRVYRVGRYDDDATFYSCWLKTQRRTELGQSYEVGESSASIDSMAVAGRYVSYEAAGGSGGDLADADDAAVVVDARTGRAAHADAVVTEEDGPAISQVLPASGGSVVWAGRAADCVGVHAFGIGVAPTTLSCGAVSDLAVSGKRVYWTQDGQPRSALLG